MAVPCVGVAMATRLLRSFERPVSPTMQGILSAISLSRCRWKSCGCTCNICGEMEQSQHKKRFLWKKPFPSMGSLSK